MPAKPALLTTIEVGEISVTHVPDGEIRIRPTHQFRGGGSSLWKAESEQLDSDGFLVMSIGAVLVESAGRNVLIDTGQGALHADIGQLSNGAREGSIESGQMLENLAACGVAPADVSAVFFTHLHSDHTGWLGSLNAPTFANAEYVVSRAEWEYWATAAPANPIVAPSAEQLLLLDGNLVFLDDDPSSIEGFSFMQAAGHTPGHVVYVVTAGSDRVIVVGDAFHSALEVSYPELDFLDDVDPVAAADTRARLRAELARPGTRLLASHFSDHVVGRVVATSADQAGPATYVFEPTADA